MRSVLRSPAIAILVLFLAAATAHGVAPSPLAVVAEGQWDDGAFDDARETIAEIPRSDQMSWVRAQELLIKIEYLEGNIDACSAVTAAVLNVEPTNQTAATFRVRCILRRGEYEAALPLAERLAEEHPSSIAFQAMHANVLEAMGETDRAQTTRRAIVELLNAQKRFDAMTLVAASEAMRAIGEFDAANQCFQLAQDLDLNDPFLKLEKIRLFRATQGYAIAEKTAFELTKFNPSIALAYAEWAEVKWAMRSKEEDVAQLCQKALELDSSLLDARCRLVFYALLKDDRETSTQLIKRNLAANPNHEPSKNLALAKSLLEGDEVSAPDNPRFYRLMAAIMNAKNDYAESLRWAELAMDAQPDSAEALHDVGMAKFRTGEYAEARAILERALAAFPYGMQTSNLLTYLDGVAKHTVADRGSVRVSHPKGDEALARYAEVRGAQILAKESATYGAKMASPITVQLCTNLHDLAVITEGIPFGCCVDPAHPATTGVVRFEDSIYLWAPETATGKWQNYRWDEALHRGITQTVVRAATNGSVPLWLEEGVAGYAVWQANEEWAPPNLGLVIADLNRGFQLPVAELAEGFLGGKRPYYQVYAPLLIQDWAVHYGAESIRALMKEIGSGTEWTDALETVFGESMEAIDSASRERILKRYEAFAKVDTAPADQAQQLFKDGSIEDAATVLAEALNANPYQPNARVLVIDLLKSLGEFQAKPEPYYELLAASLVMDRADADARLQLAEWHQANGRAEDALRYAESAAGIRPGWMAAHRLIAETALALERFDAAYASLAAIHEARPKHVKVMRDLVLCAKALNLDEDAARWAQLLEAATVK